MSLCKCIKPPSSPPPIAYQNKSSSLLWTRRNMRMNNIVLCIHGIPCDIMDTEKLSTHTTATSQFVSYQTLPSPATDFTHIHSTAFSKGRLYCALLEQHYLKSETRAFLIKCKIPSALSLLLLLCVCCVTNCINCTGIKNKICWKFAHTRFVCAHLYHFNSLSPDRQTNCRQWPQYFNILYLRLYNTSCFGGFQE